MSTALVLRAALVLSLGLSLGLPPRTALAAGNTYSEASLISAGQFLRELKEVAVTFAVDPWITKYVPEAELRTDVTSALARYGVTARSNAPVSLLVSLDQLPATIRQKIIHERGRDTMEDYRTHLFYYSMAFFVRAAALRDGKLHALVASTSTHWFFPVEENNQTRRLIIGDELRPDIKKQLAAVIPGGLEDIASRTTVDTTPWPVNGWTDKQKAAANAAYTTIMSAQSKVEKQPIDGLNSVPVLELTPDINLGTVTDTSGKDEACVADPSWRKFWQAEFQRFGWVRTQGESAVALSHQFWCTPAGKYSFPRYFQLMDNIQLMESNLVFDLNGHPVRKRAEIFSSHRMMVAVPDELSATLQGYLPRSITEFVTNLTLGNQTVPEVAMKTSSGAVAPTGAIPKAFGKGTRNAMFLGKKIVAWENDQRWYSEDGSLVLNGDVGSPLFDVRAKSGVEFTKTDVAQILELIMETVQEAKKSPNTYFVAYEYARNIAGRACFDSEGRSNCANYNALDFEKALANGFFATAEGSKYITLRCRRDALCVVRGISSDKSPAGASPQNSFIVRVASEESGMTILSKLVALASIYAKYWEPAPVVSVGVQ
jgi:hypothetical protein